MPALEFNEQPLFAGRDMKYEFALYDEDEAPIALGAADVIHAWLSMNQGGTATLALGSDTPLDGDSVVVIEALGSVGNPDPDDDVPASGYVFFGREDTEGIPDDDEWPASTQEKRYWLDLSVAYSVSGLREPCGRGRMLVRRSPVAPGP